MTWDSPIILIVAAAMLLPPTMYLAGKLATLGILRALESYRERRQKTKPSTQETDEWQ